MNRLRRFSRLLCMLACHSARTEQTAIKPRSDAQPGGKGLRPSVRRDRRSRQSVLKTPPTSPASTMCTASVRRSLGSLLEGTGAGCVWFDYNNSGLPSLYVVNGRPLDDSMHPHPLKVKPNPAAAQSSLSQRRRTATSPMSQTRPASIPTCTAWPWPRPTTTTTAMSICS